MSQSKETVKSPSPPYAPWKTFIGFIEHMREIGHVTHVDRHVLGKWSGAMQSQLLGGLRFLGFLNQNEVQPSLTELVDVHGTDEWQLKLSAVLKESYHPIIGGLDLAKTNPTILREKFANGSGITGDTLEKSVRFFLSGMEAAGIPYNPILTMKRRRRRSGSQQRLPKSQKNSDSTILSDVDSDEEPASVKAGLNYSVQIHISVAELLMMEDVELQELLGAIKKLEAFQKREKSSGGVNQQ